MVRFTEDQKSSGFELIPEGVNILQIKDLKPVMQQGKLLKLKGVFKSKSGSQIYNSYEMNPKKPSYTPSMKALYSLLKTGCGLKEDADGIIDESDAVGKFIVAEVKHNVGKDNDKVYANLSWIKGRASSFDDDISQYDSSVKSETLDDEIEDEIDDDEDPYA